MECAIDHEGRSDAREACRDLLCRCEWYRQLKKLQEENLAMEEELARRAASADAGAQLVADQQRFLQEKKRVRCVNVHDGVQLLSFHSSLRRAGISARYSWNCVWCRILYLSNKIWFRVIACMQFSPNNLCVWMVRS